VFVYDRSLLLSCDIYVPFPSVMEVCFSWGSFCLLHMEYYSLYWGEVYFQFSIEDVLICVECRYIFCIVDVGIFNCQCIPGYFSFTCEVWGSYMAIKDDSCCIGYDIVLIGRRFLTFNTRSPRRSIWPVLTFDSLFFWIRVLF
jgi:hypothetical protein